MGMISLDFNNIEGRQPLEPGFYVVRIDEAEITEAKSSGNPMIKLTYVVTADSDGNQVEGNRKLWDNLVLVPKAMWKVQQVFEALGLEASGELDFDTDELVGMEMLVKVVQEMYEGAMRNYVKDYKALGNA